MLTAGVRAACHMQLDLLIEPRQPLFHLRDEPLAEALRLRNCQLAELRPGAGDGTAPEDRNIDMQPKRVQLDDQGRGLAVGDVDEDDVLHDRRPQVPIAILVRKVRKRGKLVA